MSCRLPFIACIFVASLSAADALAAEPRAETTDAVASDTAVEKPVPAAKPARRHRKPKPPRRTVRPLARKSPKRTPLRVSRTVP